MSNAMYDSIDSVLEAVEKLLATVPDHAKAKLEGILDKEKERQAGMKRILSEVSKKNDKDGGIA